MLNPKRMLLPSMRIARWEGCVEEATVAKKTEGRYAGGPLFLEASNLFNLPTGPTLGRRAAQVKAESGAKSAGFRQKNRATPFREGPDGNQQKAAVPKGGGSSLNREASRMIGEPIRERQHATPFPRAILRANPLTIDEYG